MGTRSSRVAAITLVGLALFAARPASAAGALPRSSPEAQGISSADVLAFVKAADERIDGHAQLHARAPRPRGGRRLVDALRRGDPHMLYSLSKSFTSTAVGLAVGGGAAEPWTTPCSTFFPDEAPADAERRR